MYNPEWPPASSVFHRRRDLKRFDSHTVGLSDHSGLEQETLEIRIPSGWPCETLIEVKVITGEGEATSIIQEKISTGIAGMF
jgi:hypothetical protein